MNNFFIHLRLHSEYSITDSLIKIDKILKKAKKNKQPALAITDLSNIFGAIKFYKKAISYGIKPIIGSDIWITNEENKNKPFRLLLLIKNFNGYLQICNLLTKAWLKNSKNGKAEIKIKWLYKTVKNNNQNLIALSGAHLGNIGKSINIGNIDLAIKQAKIWKNIFKDNFYIEIQRIKQKNMELQIYKSLEIANELNLPIVATHPIQFYKEKDFIAHEARICIANNQLLKDQKRKKKFTKEQSFKTKEEMYILFKDIPEVLYNSFEIAKKCNLDLKLGKTKLPLFKTKENININILIKNKAILEFKKKFKNFFLKKKINFYIKYKERLINEINTIIKTGFSSYFLIVADFINWAKKNNIPVGPGRGSSASSLIAFLFNITNIDPLKYNLLFERFLNPERSSIPDFDIDFCPKNRDIVIKYIKKKYGKDSVAQIATFGTMAAKAAIRDTGRILGLNYNFCDSIAKLIPFKSQTSITIKNSIKNNSLLRTKIKNNKNAQELIKLAIQIEGIIKNISIHAGGIIISPQKITNFCPLYCQEKNPIIISQYDKEDIKEIGLVKFDFLGLTTLTIIQKTIFNILNNKKNIKNFNINDIPLNDKKSYKLLSTAKTTAIFQLESPGMQKILKKILPNKFEDIIILISLYRPGPMELIDIFCKRKYGEKFKFLHTKLKKILSETYGIIIFQEQIMEIARKIAGYSLKKADLLQRDLSNKNKLKISKHKINFINGSIKNGISKDKAKKIFNLIKKFSGYGFNKSHATAYALICYYTTYLKANYTTEFMAANLSLIMNNVEKIKILIKDSIYNFNINILPPNINTSHYNFLPIIKNKKYNTISYGLCAIKGIGKKVIKFIIKEREKNGIFKNLFDFVLRIEKKLINRRILSAFITSGTFDCFKTKRFILHASINIAINNAEQIKNSINQKNLFETNPEYNLNCETWGEKKTFEEEKNVLGFCFNTYPYNIYKKLKNKY